MKNQLLASFLILGLAACSSSSYKHASGEGGRYKIGKPYTISGITYYPRVDYAYDEVGLASWYGSDFQGRSTANGERFDRRKLSAAHKTIPLPSIIRVTNLENGRALNLRVNDRGPFHGDRLLDVSEAAAEQLGFRGKGIARVRVQILPQESQQAAMAVGGNPQAFSNTTPPVTSASPWGDAGIVQGSTTPPTGVQTASLAPPTFDSGQVIPTSYEQPVYAEPLAIENPTPVITPQVATTQSYDVAPIAPTYSQSTPVSYGATTPPSTSIYVQTGAFSKEDNAYRLARKLGTIETATIQPASIGGNNLYRVRMGPYSSLDQANGVMSRLVDSGHNDIKVVID